MSAQDILRETLSRLRTPLSDKDELIKLLSTSLEALEISPSPRSKDVNSHADAKLFLRYIPEYQMTLVQHVLPHWLEILQEDMCLPLIRNYFSPNLPSSSLGTHSSIPRQFLVMETIILAQRTLSMQPVSKFALDTLSTICRIHSPLDVFCYVFRSDRDIAERDIGIRWSDYIDSLFALPGRISNAAVERQLTIPTNLETEAFLTHICYSFESLMRNIVYQPENTTHQEGASLLLNNLVNLGVFPPSRPLLPSGISFWNLTLPMIRKQETNPAVTFHQKFSPTLFGMPLAAQIAVLVSLLSHLDLTLDNTDEVSTSSDSSSRIIVKRESLVLLGVLGSTFGKGGEMWSAKGSKNELLDIYKEDIKDDSLWFLVSSIINRPFTEGIARALVCWVAQFDSSELALAVLLERVTEIWCDESHIRHSTLKRHRALTMLLLSIVAELSTDNPPGQQDDLNSHKRDSVSRLSRNSAFITAVGIYIGHLDPSVRRCGMLVAEVIAQRTGGKLQFPGWDGHGDGREWAREMRALIEGKDSHADIPYAVFVGDDVNKTDQAQPTSSLQVPQHGQKVTIVEDGNDSDDSLEGYASSSSSQSSSSPKNKENAPTVGRPKLEPTVDEINEDPTLLNPNKKRIQKPVYLLDLGRLFKVDKEGNEQCESIRVGLENAANLIRKKANWGLELEENAVDLTCTIMGLQNNYDIEDFDKYVLEALTALVACSPRKAAPCITEHFFSPSYSTSHRFTMLNALALGARELAGLPTPQIPKYQASFTSKRLPAPAHRRYLTLEDEADAGAPIRSLAADLSSQAIEAGRASLEDKVPEIVRERQLTISSGQRSRHRIVEVDPSKRISVLNAEKPTTFKQLAAEYFVIPFISRFWDYLNESLGREERALRSSRSGGYRAAGTGMILSPLVLSHFVNTMSVLIHASRHSPAFLSVITPAALELCVTLGTRRFSPDTSTSTDPFATEESRHAASVLSASLELAIVILDASIELDRGRTLALEHGATLSAVMMWGKKAFNTLEGGIQLEGIGGEEEMRLRRASAGLILKLEDISGRWTQAMLMPY